MQINPSCTTCHSPLPPFWEQTAGFWGPNCKLRGQRCNSRRNYRHKPNKQFITSFEDREEGTCEICREREKADKLAEKLLAAQQEREMLVKMGKGERRRYHRERDEMMKMAADERKRVSRERHLEAKRAKDERELAHIRAMQEVAAKNGLWGFCYGLSVAESGDELERY